MLYFMLGDYMDWYFIVLIILVSLLFLVLLISFVCFMMAFFSRNKKNKTNKIIIPNNDFYNGYREEIIQDIKDVRKYNYTEYSIISFDGLKLYGRYFEKVKGAPIELMFHGYRGSSERDLSTGVKRAFLCNRNVFLVDQRGSGKSQGHVISFGINERKDCVAWVDFLTKKFGMDQKIILTGVSMGAATVLMSSTMNLPNNVIGVLADCGYSSPSEIIKKVVKEMKLPVKVFYPFIKLGARIFGKFNLEQTSPYECVQKATLPIIFFHGDKDSFVPHEMSKKLYEACTSEKKLVLIKDADHGTSYLKDPDLYIKELNDFFKNK